MGTNYYIKGYDKETTINGKTYSFYDDCSPIWHIGKRSAAGSYCYDCKVSLCINGKENVHTGSDFYNECPQCGKKREEESLSQSSGGLELGFNTNITEQKTGVKSCSSFSYAMRMSDLQNRIKEEGFDYNDRCIVDEYGEEYTYNEFLEILKVSPIQFEKSIGEYFC